jgi:type IV secretory pathway VirB6-like protein
MDALFAIIVAAIGGLLYYKNKADKASVEAKLARTQAEDQALKEQQQEVAKAIDILNKGIDQARKDREIELRKREHDSLSLKERADRIKKGLK